MPVEFCQPGCPPRHCPSVFDRVVVSHTFRAGTRVMWELLPTFADPNPLTFQLQAGQTASNDSDDWADVGLPVTDQYFAIDVEQRAWGKTNFVHYRVVLTSASGVHHSDPVFGLGVLARRDWRLLRNLARIRIKAYKLGPAGQEGYLLKRRWTGTPCNVCLDHQTREVRDPDCPTCYGTGFQCGYFYPVACVFAELSPKSHHTHVQDGRGTVDDVVVSADMLMTDLLGEQDVWVAGKTDDRYYVHEVQHTAEVKGVPLCASVKLRLVPFSSSIYSIEVPEQLRAAGLG